MFHLELFCLVETVCATVPELTVVVPYHNEEKFMRDAMSSLEKQTEQNFDVLFLDDFSTDRSSSYAAAFIRSRN